MGVLKNLFRPKIIAAIILGLALAWFLKETITPLFFGGRAFEGRNYFVQILLTGVYGLFFTFLGVLIFALIERLSAQRLNLDEIIAKEYKNLILLGAILLLLIHPLQYVTNFLSFPYPLELREPASIYSAVDLSRGINPYDLQNFPEHIYLYGILYPLVLAPFVGFFTQPLLAARWLNVLFAVLFLGMSFRIFRKRKASIISALIGTLLLLDGLCYIWKINGARPDVPGLFFAVLGFTFLLVSEPGNLRVFLCALACLLGFYFKQYMLFSILAPAVYLFLFVSKQKGYLFVGVAGLLGLGSFLLIRNFFPLYYEYSILHHIVLGSSGSTDYMLNQYFDFLSSYWLVCFFYFFYLHKSMAAFGLNRLKEIRLLPLKIKAPFIQGGFVDMIDISVIASALILTVLGKHDGNTYTYFGELLLPVLLYLVIPKIDEIFVNTDLHRFFIQALILVFCVFPFQARYQTDFKGYRQAYDIFSQYAERCGNIYDQTSLAAMYKIDHRLSPVYNSGQTEYAETVIPDKDTIYGRFSQLPAQLLNQQLRDWNDNIHTMIVNRKFDCIFSDNEHSFESYKLAAKTENVLGQTIYLRVPPKP
jgi:hypothetical protein